MKKLFRHTVKPVQSEREYDEDLQGWDGMEEVTEENTEYGEDEECYAAEYGDYYAEEPEEEYTETAYVEPEYIEPEYMEAGEFQGSEEFVELEEFGEYYAGEGGDYYVEEPEEEYIDAEYVEPEYVGSEEYDEGEESEDFGEFDEGGESADSEEYDEGGESADSGEYDEGEESADSGEYDEGEESADFVEYDEGEESADFVELDEGVEVADFGEFEESEESEDFVELDEGVESEDFVEFEESGESVGSGELDEGGEFAGVEESYEASSFWEEEGLAEPDEREDTASRKKRRRRSGKLDLTDWVMLGTGAAVLILALVAGAVLTNRKIREDQVADFVSVGAQLEGISIIGEKGLAAVADAEIAKMEAAVLTEEEEEKKGYDETAYDRQISIAPVFTSIHKDLKIKFINQRTGKLVPNVPFAVAVTDPSGKSVVWSDDDMDGVIYKKNIAAGNYQVTMELLQDSLYSDYAVSADTQTAAVQEEIVYKQVDVANEVKKESEVNVAKEDTKKNETVVESVLTDTVAWVESKVIGVTYNEIAKSAIPDPAAIAIDRILIPAIEESEISGVTSEQAGDTAPEPGTEEPPEPGITSEPGTEETPEPEPDVTPEPEPDVTPEPDSEPDSEPGSDSGRTLALDRSSATVFLTVPVAINVTVDDGQSAPGSVAAESSNAEVAQVSVSGWAVTVTGVGEGSADIIVRYMEDGEEAQAACAVTVKKHPREDTGTKLKDAAGNQLYVLENGAYREAVHADYYQAERFFLKGGALYSGWQTIEGKIYYFTADGVKVTGEQIIQGAKYQFAGDGALVTGEGVTGIDVSKWNGTIDWNAVKNSGISYVVIRCGYRGSSAGKLIEDPQFDANIKGVLAAGLKVGVYFFSQAVDEIEAVEEASMVLEQIKKYKISYPVFIDVERSGGRGDKIDRNTRTAVCKAFCQTIQNANYTAGIYSNKLWMEQQINMAELNAYKVWLAQYVASPTYSGKYDMWQYKANGSVSGISGNVDLNISYLE